MDIKNWTDDDIDSYLMNVIDETGGRVLISPLRVTYDKFIQPKTPCMASVAKAHAFVVDCVDAYKNFLKYYRDCPFGETLAQQIQVVDNFIKDYFGFMGNDEQRQRLNLQNPDLHSIRVYKGQNCAMCFERAILSHNLLKLLGLNSVLVTKNFHTYNIILNKNMAYLYDPTNPTIADIKGKTYRFPTIRIINSKNLPGYLFGNDIITINPGFYEFMFGATNVRVPKLQYPGLGLENKNINER